MRWLLALCLLVAGCRNVAVLDELTTPSFDFELTFVGNAALDDGALKRAIAFDLGEFAAQEHSRAAGDDAAFALEVYYHGRGYRKAEVQYTAGPGARLELRIVEGPRTTVDEESLTANGVTVFDREELSAFFNGPRLGTLGRGDLIFIESRLRSSTLR